MIPGHPQELYKETTRFISGEAHPEASRENFTLPGQTTSYTPPMAGHYPHNYNMNGGGGDCGDPNNGFSGMYEADSNYRWRKIRGNLDLFVMERNERHLTSLQWKWQKMPRSRRRTPGYEQPQFFNEPGADVYKQMPESARTRSRAESRQRMREELDTYFYERWKNADERQNGAESLGDKIPGDFSGGREERNPQTATTKTEHDYFNDSQQGPPFGYNLRNNNAAKWSRYGYYPDKSFGQEISPPGYPQQPYLRNQQINNATPHRENPDEQYLPRAAYGYNKPPNASHLPSYPSKYQNRSNLKEPNDDYGFYANENSESYNQPEWNRRSLRYPPNYPNVPAYANYGYAHDYNYTQPHPRQRTGDYPPQYPPIHPRQSMPSNFDQSNKHIDPWLKKDMEPMYASKRFMPPMAYHNSRACFNEIKDLVFTENGPRCHRRPRFVEGREDPPLQQTVNYRPGNEKMRMTVSRRKERNNDDNVSTVPEEAGDDDVFLSPQLSPQTKDDMARWADQSDISKVKQNNDTHDDKDKYFMDHEAFSQTPKANLLADERHHKSNSGFDKSVETFLPTDHVNVTKPQLPASPSLPTTLDFDSPIKCIPTAMRLPPLHADGLSSGHRTPVTPFVSPGSSTLSASKSNRSDVRTRSSTKRVAFACEIVQGNDVSSLPSSPKRGKYPKSAEKEVTNPLSPSPLSVGLNTAPYEVNNDDIGDTASHVSKNKEKQMTQDDESCMPSSKSAVELNQSILITNEPTNEPADLPRELTTINVGDIDVKSELEGKSVELQDDKLPLLSLVESETHKIENQHQPAPIAGNIHISDPPQPELIKENSSASSKKSKQSLWKMTKLLTQKMGSKLSLKKEQSCVSQTNADRNIPKPDFEKINTPQEDLSGNENDVTSQDAVCDPVNDLDVNSSIATDKAQPDLVSDPAQICQTQTLLSTSTEVEVSPNSKPDDFRAADEEQHKNFHQEELQYQESRRRNEETTSKLLKEQNDMEKELHNLRLLLNEELSRQHEHSDVNEKFDKKISEIEQHIIDLDKKLSETSDKLQENDMKAMTLHHQEMNEVGEGLPPNAPLFILADPEHGTAAAVTQGYSEDIEAPITMQNTSMIPYSNGSYYNESISAPSSYTVYTNTLDETKRQQEEFKAELEAQMANLKMELEQQLKERRQEECDPSEMVIDVRVTNLELQIAEMNHKILEAENVIRNAEEEKLRRIQEKETQAEIHIEPKSAIELEAAAELSSTKNHENPTISPLTSPKIGKKLCKDLSQSFHRNSTKVSPDPMRRLSVSHSDISSAGLKKRLDSETDKKRIQKLFDTEGGKGNSFRNKEKNSVGEDDDDDVIILDDISTENLVSEGDKADCDQTLEPKTDQPVEANTVVQPQNPKCQDRFRAESKTPTLSAEVYKKPSVDESSDPVAQSISQKMSTEVAAIHNNDQNNAANQSPPTLNKKSDDTEVVEVAPVFILKKDTGSLDPVQVDDNDKGILLEPAVVAPSPTTVEGCSKLDNNEKEARENRAKVTIGPATDDNDANSEDITFESAPISSVLKPAAEKERTVLTQQSTFKKLNRETVSDESKTHPVMTNVAETSRTRKNISEKMTINKPSDKNVSNKEQTSRKSTEGLQPGTAAIKKEKGILLSTQSKKSSHSDATNIGICKDLKGAKGKSLEEKATKGKDGKSASARSNTASSTSSALHFLSKFRNKSKPTTQNKDKETATKKEEQKPKVKTKQVAPTKLLVSSSKINAPRPQADEKPVAKSWWQNKFGKQKHHPEKVKMEQIKTGKETDSRAKIPTRSAVTNESETTSKGMRALSIESKKCVGSSKTPKLPKSKRKPALEMELTVTTMDSEFTQVEETISAMQSRNSKLSEWATTSGMSSRAGQGWDGRPESKMSLFYGIGTTWCVCPQKIWKYLGDESDDEPVTRRKCISLIMGLVLVLLLFAIVIGLIIGLATSMQDPTESPIRFVVIPGNGDITEETELN